MTSSPNSADLAPPRGGLTPPTETTLAGGEAVWLRPVAEEISRRVHAEFPDERERYGDAGFEWCVHDNQHLLNWASLSDAVFQRQLDWLAELLEVRAYPLARLARDLEIAGDVVDERWGEAAAPVSARLRAGAATVRGTAGENG